MANCGSGVAHMARPLLGKISSTSIPSRSWSARRPIGSAPALLRAWSSPSSVDRRSRSGRWPSLPRHCTPSLSVITRGRRSRYFSSMRSTHRFAGSLAWPSADAMKYFFAASGRALRGQLEAPGVSRRQRLGSLTTIWLIVSSSSTSFLSVGSRYCDLRPFLQVPFDAGQHALAGFQLGRRHVGRQPALDFPADLGRALGEVTARAREIDAAGAAVGLVRAPLDQAAALEVVEQTNQRRPLDRQRRRQLLLANAVTQAPDIDQRPPRRLGEAEHAQLGIHRLTQTARDPRDAKAEIDLLGRGHGRKIGC